MSEEVWSRSLVAELQCLGVVACHRPPTDRCGGTSVCSSICCCKCRPPGASICRRLLCDGCVTRPGAPSSCCSHERRISLLGCASELDFLLNRGFGQGPVSAKATVGARRSCCLASSSCSVDTSFICSSASGATIEMPHRHQFATVSCMPA